MGTPILDQWVGDPQEFFSAYWETRPGVFRPPSGTPSPFTLADVDTVLETGLFREPYFEMWEEGPIPLGSYTITRHISRAAPGGFADGGRIRSLLEKGATLLLRSVDHWHGPTREVLAALAGELGRGVEAFFFVTPPGHQGLPLHRDDADVLVLQVAGRKDWRIHAKPDSADWRAGPVDPSAGPEPAEILRTTLDTGEVLYVPRGFAHSATGERGLSAHLSVTVRDIGTADLGATLHGLLTEGLPAERPLGHEAITDAAERLLQDARDRLMKLSAADLVGMARRQAVARMPGRPDPADLEDLATAWNATAGTGPVTS
ncbi:JmjC domain-containing protein [Streptomyces olivaceoviridis]